MPTFPGSATRQSASIAGRGSARRQVGPPVDADHARRMRRRRDLGEQRRLDVLARDEQLDRLGGRRRDEILALAGEEAELVAPAPLVQLAHELQLLVVAGGRSPAATRSRRARYCGERRLRLLGELAELLGIADREVGEHLAVELDLGRLQARR